MKRKAIIIGSPLYEGEQDYLAGVKLDKLNYCDFLQSCEAGQWSRNEIIYLENPTWATLKSYLDLCNQRVDICYVIFSGHGEVRNEKTFLQLNENEKINHTWLHTNAKRQITIMDTYRYPVAINVLEGFSNIGNVQTGLHYEYDNFFFKSTYENLIQKMPSGKIDIFSASIGQYSSDIANKGGWFTYNFLKIAEQAAGQVNIVGNYFTINGIFIKIQNFMKGNQISQNIQVPKGIYYDDIGLKKIPFILHYENILYLRNQNRLKLRQ